VCLSQACCGLRAAHRCALLLLGCASLPCPAADVPLLCPSSPLSSACRADPRAVWGATFLCWLKQEIGLGRVLIGGLGLETVVRINRPVQVC
jgi:hypothetical protein